MNITGATSAHDIPRPPADQALSIVEIELAAALALLRDLDATDWHRPTACTGWTVHDVVAHMIGQAEGMARPDRMFRRILRARRHGTAGLLDRQNQYQVQDRVNVPDQQLVTELQHWGDKAVRAARRIPAPPRRLMRLSLFFPEEAKLLPEDSFDYLLRVLMARDAWMHRLDIAAATSQALALDQHDGHVVGQVVRDLATFWTGQALFLELSGPAGGRWIVGGGCPVATVHDEAIAFMRRLSGRPTDTIASIDGDPTVGAALLATRIEF
jgi:uncharacterized protein (TIGR03083 family)